MANVTGSGDTSFNQFNITESTATPIGFFSGRKITRLEIGAEGSELFKIRATANASIEPLLQSNQPESSLGFFQRNVTVRLGNTNYDVNISSCAKRLGITREDVFNLAKTGQLENKLNDTATEFIRIKNSLKSINDESALNPLTDFIMHNKEKIQDAIERTKQTGQAIIDTGVSKEVTVNGEKKIINYEIGIEKDKIVLLMPQDNVSSRSSSTQKTLAMPQEICQYLGFASFQKAGIADQFLSNAIQFRVQAEAERTIKPPDSVSDTLQVAIASQPLNLEANIKPVMLALSNTGLENQTTFNEENLKQTIKYLSENKETIAKQISASKTDSILLSSKATGLARTIEVYKTGKVLVHLNKKQQDPTAGKGSFKEVRFALDVTDAKLVAVIKLPKEKRTKNSIEEIIRETGILREFTGCSNVVQITGSYGISKEGQIQVQKSLGNRISQFLSSTETTPTKEKVFILQPFYNAGSLKGFLQLDSHLDHQEANKMKQQLALNILQGCSEVENKGYIHGDIKPENIFINSEDGKITAHLGDFGAAVKVEEKKVCPQSTAPYQSPEILNAETTEQKISATNPKLDSWALGVTLYRLFKNGAWPFSQGLNAPPRQEFIKNLQASNQTLLNLEGLGKPEKELLNDLLSIDTAKRLTPSEALEKYKQATFRPSSNQLPNILIGFFST